MEIRYGSDKHGLICGYRFSSSAPGSPIGLDEAAAWLRGAQTADPSDFVWLHFNLADASAQAWMKTQLAVAPEFFDALSQGSRSTRIEDAQDTLIAVVNDVAFEFTFDRSDIKTLWVNVGPHLALSARLHPLRSIDSLRQAVKDGVGLGSSVAFLTRLLRDQGDVLVDIVRKATLQVDDVEDGLVSGRLNRRRADLGKLRRVLVRLRRLLAPEPGALFRLLHQPPPWIVAHDLEGLRQATEEFSIVIRDLAELQERIKLLQEELAARVGEQTSHSVFMLTVVTVLALPINMVAGLLGMNVGGVPLADSPHGFVVIVGIVVTVTALAGWWALRTGVKRNG